MREARIRPLGRKRRTNPCSRPTRQNGEVGGAPPTHQTTKGRTSPLREGDRNVRAPPKDRSARWPRHEGATVENSHIRRGGSRIRPQQPTAAKHQRDQVWGWGEERGEGRGGGRELSWRRLNRRPPLQVVGGHRRLPEWGWVEY